MLFKRSVYIVQMNERKTLILKNAEIYQSNVNYSTYR